MQDEYRTIAGITQTRLEVKKSRFIGLATSVSLRQEVSEFLNFAQTEYPRATHYCYAYRIGFDNRLVERSSDAGEPTNSAGVPILSAVHASGLENILCVVVRYFGGIKLGIGGLIRAYGKCARDCLANASLETRYLLSTVCIQTPYPQIGSVINLVQRLQGNILNLDSAETTTQITLEIRQSLLLTLQDGLKAQGKAIKLLQFQPTLET